MGIVTKTITECTCDLCGSVCKPKEGEIRVNVSGGDRDVGPSQVYGVLVFNQPYGCVNGIICKSCKIKWLRIYLELHGKQ